MILFSQLPKICKGEMISLFDDSPIEVLLTDSRKGITPARSVFFATKGIHHDGHDFIFDLYQQGVRNFILEYVPDKFGKLPEINIFLTPSSLNALQEIAAFHRSQIDIPVVAITGSNGKTIIKEWLYVLLSAQYRIVKNPGSYNSQLGVPLSVWQIQPHHQLGIFEAGISKPGEMQRLAQIIQPTIGVFTNLGPAHDEGFKSREEKLREKLVLFDDAQIVVYCSDDPVVKKEFATRQVRTFTWGSSPEANVVASIRDGHIDIQHKTENFSIDLPFKDHASVENCLHCIAVMIYLGYTSETIARGMMLLRSVPMRLELKEGINQCQIIDDTYNNDLSGLRVSLEFLSSQRQKKIKRLILSDIFESGLSDEILARKVSSLISQYDVDRFVAIGKQLKNHKQLFPASSLFFDSTDAFLEGFRLNELEQEIILIKGARSFAFEKVASRLQRKVHGTVMEIDLGAIVSNLNSFKAMMKPSTKIMVMVKAFGYGSGSTEIANLLQYHKVDYLGVAYADEGVELRRNNISVPIMVMNPSEDTFDTLLTNNLEAEIYSFRILEQFIKFLNGRTAIIHIKLDTGMHRLGFEEKEVDHLIDVLLTNPQLRVATIFSHLAAADEAQHDQFSISQAETFKRAADKISDKLRYRPLYHLLNSSGILRLAQYQFDLVRLGIGLYGVDPTNPAFSKLTPVTTLKTIISQIKHIKAGETIGYGRRGIAEKDISVATIAIGYADGFSRAFSRGVGEVLIHGKRARVIGNVCMDMTMIDITNIDAREGDDVIIFGKDMPINLLAEKIKTIPYEILTNTAERVKRVFVAESI